jgi:3-oxoacyl-[acyl-carrier protein] reductase
MDLALGGKVVLVTGGSRGIGLAIARAFKAEGAFVCIASRTESELRAVSADVGFYGIVCDVTDPAQRQSLIADILQHYGRLDVLVNNAGGSNGGSIRETDEGLFREAMELNFHSIVGLSKLAAAKMRPGSVILNITSISGRESGGRPTYNAAKSAAISFTKALADELIQSGIRVCGIAPGSILHPSSNWQKRLEKDPQKIEAFVKEAIPAGRFGTVEEVASVAVFLASDQARWVVGATLNVDGGQSRMNF